MHKILTSDIAFGQMSQLVLDFSLAFLVAAYGTLVGAGGGFLLVPLLLLLREFPHTLAVGTSLAVVSANALSAAAGFLRQKKVDLRAGLVFAVCTLPGALIGAFLTASVEGAAFRAVFGGTLVLVAVYLLIRGGRKESSPFRGKVGLGWVQRAAYSYYEPLGAFFSVGVGFFSSLLGIGGGIIHVPLMTEVLRFPVHVAVATSQFILVFTALTGFASHLYQDHVNWPVALPMMVGAVAGAQAGVWLSKRIGGPATVRLLALALVAVGVRLLLK
jgi:uncharacterized membrane protein YfcA